MSPHGTGCAEESVDAGSAGPDSSQAARPSRGARRWALLAAGSALVLVVAGVLRAGSSPYATAPYEWEPVEISGGGWVTGLVVADSGQPYARTDVGGAYRWDEDADEWRQLISVDSVPDPAPADYDVEALAVAPSDDDVVYAAVGDTLEQRVGTILRSTDGGESWDRSGQRFTVHGNAEWRQAGARLAVHPDDPEVVLFGSRAEGLWRSTDGGERWRRLPGLPPAVEAEDGEPAGVTFVLFASSGRSDDGPVLWAGVAGKGVLRSEDAGASWRLVHETPGATPRDAEVASDGRLYVAVSGGSTDVVRVSPDGEQVRSIGPGGTPAVLAVDPEDPDRLFVGDEGVRDGFLWRSRDGGKSWDALDISIESGEAVWPVRTDLEGYMSAGELTFDRADPGRLWFAEGMGVWRSSDLDDGEVTWDFTSGGIEELVTNDVVKPESSALLSAHWDRNVFRHPGDEDGAVPAVTGRFNSAWSLDVAASDPSFVAVVIDDHRFCCDEDGLAGMSGYSEDGGETWQRFPSLEDGTHPEGLQFGNIAVSSGSRDDLVWVPSNGGRVHYTTDRGRTWAAADYPGSEPHFAHYLRRDALTADPGQPGTFYVLDADGVLRSTDGGATWTLQRGDGLPGAAARRFNATLTAVPGRSGELLMSTGLLDETSHGLYRSVDAGASWTELPVLDDVSRVGFVTPEPGARRPDVVAAGRRGDTTGLWRSSDTGATWELISEAPAGRYQDITVLAGDPEVTGRVYVGFTGTGLVQGDPE